MVSAEASAELTDPDPSRPFVAQVAEDFDISRFDFSNFYCPECLQRGDFGVRLRSMRS